MERHVVKRAMWYHDQPVMTNEPLERREQAAIQQSEILVRGLIELLEMIVRIARAVVEFLNLKLQCRDCLFDLAPRVL